MSKDTRELTDRDFARAISRKQRARLAQRIAEVLGETEGNWDVAYVVRAEAKRARTRMEL